MHPILFQLGEFKLHTYGALLGIGFLIAMMMIVKRAKLLGIAEQHIDRLIFLAFFFGIAGGRLLFILVDDPMGYLYNPLEIFKVWKGGLVFFGGFLMALGACWFYTIKHRLPILAVFDLFTPGLVLGHALGRLGCFMAGCCYGKICHLPWAVTFTDPHGVGLKNVPLHPTQLYESLFLIVLFFSLLLIRPRGRFTGMVFFVYLAIYPVGRSIIELYRNDMRGGLMGLSTAQWISIPTFILALTFLLRGMAKARAKTAKALTA
jgi:phosphatidylglycerol:prolipoprotein diacylglycerol transferase